MTSGAIFLVLAVGVMGGLAHAETPDYTVSAEGDCRDPHVTVPQLDRIAASPQGSSMEGFLRALPAGSLPTFTFVTNSQSLQRGGTMDGKGVVSSEWPRVIRASSDGKLTLTFVCDPNNPTYGTVEALYFDESTQSMRSREYEFTAPGRKVEPNHRIHDSPESCVSCHATHPGVAQSPLKFNWPEYFFWGDCSRRRGITLYGSDDDSLGVDSFRSRFENSPEKTKDGCNDAKDREAHRTEVAEYQQFREKQKNNPCFNTLPWPKGAAPQYPYNAEADTFKAPASLRPNLRLTDAYSRLTALRNAQRFKSAGPLYDVLKYTLVMEASRCFSRPGMSLESEYRDLESKIGNGFKIDRKSADGSYQIRPLQLSLSNQLGMTAADWSLEFRASNPNYNSGNVGISQMVSEAVLEDIGRGNPAVRESVSKSSPAAASCGRGISGLLSDANDAYSDLCKTLRAEREKALPAALAAYRAASATAQRSPCPPDQALPVVVPPVDPEKLIRNLNDSIEHGRQLAQTGGAGHCVNCHAGGAPGSLPPENRFVPNEHESPGQQASSLGALKKRFVDRTFGDTLRQRVVQDADMPPGGGSLTADDRLDLMNYLMSLK